MAFANHKDKEAITGVLDTLGLKTEGPHDVQEGVMADNADNLQRHLGNRQIQLIAIGGSIGTALFVSIGTGLYHGGPGSLFLAYSIQSIFLAMINNCLAEMSTAFPVSGGFIRLAGKWVDDALGFMVGWNFLFVFTSFFFFFLFFLDRRPSFHTWTPGDP
jgi:amino acid transporter